MEVTGRNDAGFYQDDPSLGVNATTTISRTWNVQSFLGITAASWSANQLTLHFPAIAGNTYTVQFKNSLSDPNWSNLLNVPAQPVTGDYAATDSGAAGQSRFYQIVSPAQ